MHLKISDIRSIARKKKGIAVLRSLIEHVRPGFLYAVATQHPEEIDSRGNMKHVLPVCIGNLGKIIKDTALDEAEFEFIKKNMDIIKIRSDHPNVSRYYWLANYVTQQDLGQIFMTPEGEDLWVSSMHDWRELPSFIRS